MVFSPATSKKPTRLFVLGVPTVSSSIDSREKSRFLPLYYSYTVCRCEKYGVFGKHHNLGLGTNYVFLHVGWVQNLNLFLVVFLLVSTRATWDSGTKY